MKKFGFTLAEILLSMAIIGIVAAITAPTLINMMPNKNKVLTIKYHKIISEINSELLNDRSLYEDGMFDDNYQYAKERDENLLLLDKTGAEFQYLRTNKNAYLFMKKLDLANGWDFSKETKGPEHTGYFSKEGAHFTTADGIFWEISTDSKNIHTIDIDMNGEAEGPNSYASESIKNPDKFVFKIASDGSVSCDETNDPITCRYLACPYYMNNKSLDHKCMKKHDENNVSKNDECYCWSK